MEIYDHSLKNMTFILSILIIGVMGTFAYANKSGKPFTQIILVENTPSSVKLTEEIDCEKSSKLAENQSINKKKGNLEILSRIQIAGDNMIIKKISGSAEKIAVNELSGNIACRPYALYRCRGEIRLPIFPAGSSVAIKAMQFATDKSRLIYGNIAKFTAPFKEFQPFSGVWESDGLAASCQIQVITENFPAEAEFRNVSVEALTPQESESWQTEENQRRWNRCAADFGQTAMKSLHQLKMWSPLPSVTDRKFWDEAAKSRFAGQVIDEAEKRLAEPLAVPTEQQYRDCFVTNDRAKYDGLFTRLRNDFILYLLAACFTQKPEYLKKFELTVDALCNRMKTWVFPAHDRYPHVNTPCDVINRKDICIDLRSAEVGAMVSVGRQTLLPLLQPEVASAMQREVMRQVIAPLLEVIHGKRRRLFFMNIGHNWNPVCWSQSVIAALAAEITPEERGKIAEWASGYTENYFHGVSDDGYCSEGPGYWEFGFGSYCELALALYEATNHKLNLLQRPAATEVSGFAENIMLAPNIFPAFADCSLEIKANRMTLNIKDFLLGKVKTLSVKPERSARLMNQLLALGLSNHNDDYIITSLGENSLFPAAGVFVFRQGDNRQYRLSLALKGGSNDELHNHNDVGSYVLSVDEKFPILIDPGWARYRMDSFAGARYKCRIRGSYGHPVPLVCGKEQVSGLYTHSRLLEQSVEKQRKFIRFDISPAYQVPGLRKLEREFEFGSSGSGCFVLTDTVEFEHPGTFENALVTFGTLERIDSNLFKIRHNGQSINVAIDTGGLPFEIKEELIDDDINYPQPVRRIGICLKEKVSEAKLKITVIPNRIYNGVKL